MGPRQTSPAASIPQNTPMAMIAKVYNATAAPKEIALTSRSIVAPPAPSPSWISTCAVASSKPRSPAPQELAPDHRTVDRGDGKQGQDAKDEVGLGEVAEPHRVQARIQADRHKPNGEIPQGPPIRTNNLRLRARLTSSMITTRLLAPRRGLSLGRPVPAAMACWLACL